MAFRRLLAKSAEDPRNPLDSQTLVGHSRQVAAAMRELLSIFQGTFKESLVCGVSPMEFQGLAMISAWLHDLGKANDHFQEAVRKKRSFQGVRHEVVGFVQLFQLWNAPGDQFWGDFPPWGKDAVLAAIVGHHLKFPTDERSSKGSIGSRLTFLGGHSDVHELTRLMGDDLGMQFSFPETDRTYSLLFGGDLPSLVIEATRGLFRKSVPSESVKRVVASLKTLLLCADLVGSALPERKIDLSEWLRPRLQTVLRGEDLLSVVQEKLSGSSPRPFQQEIAGAIAETVILTAGCGAGKTAAAYLWASRQAAGRRLFFCYPTTATASEGFMGYLRDPAFDAILKHSRVATDYRLLEQMPEPGERQAELRQLSLEVLETWPVPVVVCTAHTVLGLLQNYRTGLYSLPSLCRAAFVFDEVHAYSPLLFQHLLRFLEVFNRSPVLLMTATLPPVRKAALIEVARVRGGCLEVQGPLERETAARYLLLTAETVEAWQKAEEVLASGGKVLWVRNTVKSAVAIGETGESRNLPVKVFHSRFRYRDRLHRQRSLVESFSSSRPVLAIATQIAEMSLDLSADLLVTDLAPVPALIQRLGRLNRRADRPACPKAAFFLEPESEFPYARKRGDRFWIDRSRSWVEGLADGSPKSQEQIQTAYHAMPPDPDEDMDPAIVCEWLDNPIYSRRNARSIMEPSHSIELIRAEDLGSGPPEELVIPMPIPHRIRGWEKWPTKGRFLVAPEGVVQYDEKWGASYADGQSDPWII